MPNDKAPLMSINNLSFSYGNVSVLFDISLKVDESQVVTLLGANGAGKSTLLKVITGCFHTQKGEVIYEGQPITNMPVQKIVQKGISFIPEGRHIFRELTVEDNLQLGAYIQKNKSHGELEALYEEMYDYFPILKERRKQIAGTLSGGQQQMLCIACGLLSRPKLLIIDEPSLGLAPKIINEVWKILFKLKEKGLTILLIEQNAKLALDISDYIYILKHGSFTAQGTSRYLCENDLIKESYF
jgi:ABC-type branched-chain amino acid transport systems, ATPase component